MKPITIQSTAVQPTTMTVLFEERLTDSMVNCLDKITSSLDTVVGGDLANSLINCLDAIADCAGRGPKQAARLEFVFVELGTGKLTYLRGDGSMAYTLPVDRKVTALIQPVDMYGNPAKIDGIPVWSVSDPAALLITPAADGLSCVVEPAGPLAVSQLRVDGDADLGTGVKPIVGLADIETVAGEAQAFNIQFGTPEPK